MNSVLISADQTWALWAVLLSCAALGLWAERSGAGIGSRISGAVITMLSAFALSNLNVIPAAAPSYEVVWEYLVPLAIPLLLVNADLRRILTESGPMLIAFMIGACGTVLGVLLGFSVLPLGQHDWQLAAVFTATYIGGSLNYVATAKAVGLEDNSLLTTGMAADNLMMIVYFLILFSLPSIVRLRSFFHERSGKRPAAEVIPDKNNPTGGRSNVSGMAFALAMSLLVCAFAFELEKMTPYEGTAILIITLVSLMLATLWRSLMKQMNGAMETGTLLMQIFFATIGASANIHTVIQAGPVLLAFAGIILLVHLLVMLCAGYFAKLSLPEILIASNANTGGPTTALAMASARRWHDLMVPAALCGTLGYASGNFIGLVVGNLLK